MTTAKKTKAPARKPRGKKIAAENEQDFDPQRSIFTRGAEAAAEFAGSTQAFIGAFAAILIWAATGPLFKFSDTWQIVINTATTIITFLLVFLIQNSQNRDTRAIHLKLDELIRCTEGAHTVLLDLEKLNADELKHIHCRYQQLAADARRDLRKGIADTGVINIEMEKK